MILPRAYCSCSLFLILFLQWFFHEKTISQIRLDFNMILWTFLTCAERQFSLRQTSSMKWNFRGSLWWQFQFWLWKSILELTYGLLKVRVLFCCWLSTPFPCQSMGGQHSTPNAGSDHRFVLSSACPWEALRAVQGGGWYMAQSTYDLWALLQVQGTVLILQNGLETDLHLTEPSNLFLVCLFPTEHLPRAALFQNH